VGISSPPAFLVLIDGTRGTPEKILGHSKGHSPPPGGSRERCISKGWSVWGFELEEGNRIFRRLFRVAETLPSQGVFVAFGINSGTRPNFC
jgi:hypothetical protein